MFAEFVAQNSQNMSKSAGRELPAEEGSDLASFGEGFPLEPKNLVSVKGNFKNISQTGRE